MRRNTFHETTRLSDGFRRNQVDEKTKEEAEAEAKRLGGGRSHLSTGEKRFGPGTGALRKPLLVFAASFAGLREGAAGEEEAPAPALSPLVEARLQSVKLVNP